MNKKIAKISLCALVIVMFFTSNIALALNDTRNNEKHVQYGTSNSLGLQYLIDTEILIMRNTLFGLTPVYDHMVGNGMVRGFFLAIKCMSTVTVFLSFHEWVPPGWTAFDLLCTNILVKVTDPNGNIVNQHNITNPSGTLFVNNWYGSVTLTRPPPSPGQYFFVVIEIYGNYE